MDNNSENKPENTWGLWVVGVAILASAIWLCLVVAVGLVSYGTFVLSSHPALPQPPVTVQAYSTSMPPTALRITAFPTPTNNIQASPTTAAQVDDWPTLIRSNFDLNDGWPAGNDSDPNYGTLQRRITNGKYAWQTNTLSDVDWFAYPQIGILKDFVLTVEAEKLSGSQYTAYGVNFRRVDGDNFYNFHVRPDSQDFSFTIVKNGAWAGGIAPTYSTAIHSSGVNRITIVATGSHFVFYINDQYVAEADDGAFTAGTVGLELGVNRAASNISVEFDNFEIRGPAETFTATPVFRPSPDVTAAPSAGSKLTYNNGDAIFSINRDGTDVKILAIGNQPDWSPDGHLLVFSQGVTNSHIFVTRPDGSNLTQLTFSNDDESYPVWSPDGKQIAFMAGPRGQTDLFIMDLNGTNMVQLTTDDLNETTPAWRPNGQQIAFSTVINGKPVIEIINVDGTDRKQIMEDALDPAWSPDGKTLAFSSERDGDSEIYLMDADGGNVRQLTQNETLDIDPSWSPDGSSIAFVERSNYTRNLYIMKADGSKITQLTRTFTNVANPIWQP